MGEMKGKASLEFEHPPVIVSAASVVGKKEGEGPLGPLFDQVEQDDMCGKDNWEQAESALQKQAADKAIEKGGLRKTDLRYLFAGDLLGQLIATSFGTVDLEVPLFGLYGMELKQIIPVGGGNHLRLVCAKRGATLTCMKFSTRPEEFPFAPGEVLDLAVTLEAKEFRGEPQLTVSVREAKLSGLNMEECVHTYRLYESIRRGESLTPAEGGEVLPTRQDLAGLYRKLVSYQGSAFGVQALLGSLPGMNLGKLLLGLDMLQERRLVALMGGEERRSAQILPTQGKVDIFASPVYQQAKALVK